MSKNIHIKEEFGNTLDTRDQAVRLMQLTQLERAAETDIILDFRGVDFMSRSFADQFYKEQQSDPASPHRLQIVNADTQIIEIMAAVSKTQRNERQFTEYPVYTFENYDDLMDYLEAI